MIRRPPRSTLFPYTTSSDLNPIGRMNYTNAPPAQVLKVFETVPNMYLILSPDLYILTASDHYLDRKSTRLNSSHANISYAVFCLKKKHLNLFLIIALYT